VERFFRGYNEKGMEMTGERYFFLRKKMKIIIIKKKRKTALSVTNS
jgi:hypothetical protein